MAKDPTCGMEVDEAKAIEGEYQDQTYYFCSEPCKKSFEENPEIYLKKLQSEE